NEIQTTVTSLNAMGPPAPAPGGPAELLFGRKWWTFSWSHDWQRGWSHGAGKTSAQVVPSNWQATEFATASWSSLSLGGGDRGSAERGATGLWSPLAGDLFGRSSPVAPGALCIG